MRADPNDTAEPSLNPSPPPLCTRARPASDEASWPGTWAHALIWLLLAVAGLLLVGFTALVNDITERGELRRSQQRSTGSLLLPDEPKARAVDVTTLLTLTGERWLGR